MTFTAINGQQAHKKMDMIWILNRTPPYLKFSTACQEMHLSVWSFEASIWGGFHAGGVMWSVVHGQRCLVSWNCNMIELNCASRENSILITGDQSLNSQSHLDCAQKKKFLILYSLFNHNKEGQSLDLLGCSFSPLFDKIISYGIFHFLYEASDPRLRIVSSRRRIASI